MVKLVSQWILFPIALMTAFVALLWTVQHPVVIILTIVGAAAFFFALRPFAKRHVKTNKKLHFARK